MTDRIKLVPSIILLVAGILCFSKAVVSQVKETQVSSEFTIPETAKSDPSAKETEQAPDSVVSDDPKPLPPPKNDKAEPPKVTPSSQPNKPSTRWTYPGDLGSHLRTTHGVDVTGMSHSDMLAIHDDLHNSALAGPPRNLVVPHFASWCTVCKSDKAAIFPKWLKAGWSLADPVDETRKPLRNVYPWYEIYDETGKVTVHLGSLSTFKKK